MSKERYIKEPPEYDDLVELIKYNPLDLDILSKRVGFYDTCSIQYHSTFSNPEILVDYFGSRFDVLLITRTVLMELSTESILVQKIKEYIKFLIQNGVQVSIFEEEDVCKCILDDFEWNEEEINNRLLYAIRSVSNVPMIKKAFESAPDMKQIYLNQVNNSSTYYSDFFEWIRGKKESKDGLGECLIMIINHVMCSPIQTINSKRIIVSDDRKMYSVIVQVRENVKKYYNQTEPGLLTTPAIMSYMYRKKICEDIEVLKKLGLSTKHSETDIFNFAILDESANIIIEKSGNISNLIVDICNPEILKIVF